MADSVHQLIVGREAVVGTLAATTFQVRFQDASITPNFLRITPPEENGTRIEDLTTQASIQQGEIKIKTLLYFDSIVWWLIPVMGTYSSALHAAATAAWDHTLKAGGTAPATLSVQVYDGVDWWQMLGCSVDSIQIDGAPDKLPELSIDIKCFAPAKISAPSIPAFDIPAYNHPISTPLQALTVGGSDLSVVKYTLSLKNDRKALHTVRTSQAPVRHTVGKANCSWDMELLYTAYTGSPMETYVGNSALGALVLSFTDSTTIDNTVPSITFTSTTTKIEKANKNKKTPPTQTVKAVALYNTSDATNLKCVVTNERNTTYYAGT